MQLLDDGDITFELGADANSDAEKLPPGRYVRGMNVVNRGGVVQCRPGYRCLMALPEGRLQGFFIFKPKAGPEVLLFAVDGSVYRSEYPFNSFTLVPGIHFSSSARQLYWMQAEQSFEQNLDGSISFITPKNILVIQDGGITPPAVYDGTTATHQRGPGKIPLGGPMLWLADRLWVGRDNLLFASDLSDPLSFVEPQYISTVQAFVLPGTITAIASTPTSNQELAQLLVFTTSTTDLIQGGIRDRSLWPTTPDMQRTIFPDIGLASERGIIQQNGFSWWYSKFGLISLDAALMSKRTSKLPYRDLEMQDSKARLSSDLAGVALGAKENYLLVSVPYADQFNRHTWCLDQSPRETLNEESAPAWNSYWTGTRPMQWITTDIRGENRVFYISPDFDGINRLWEAFMPDRLDGGCPISWWYETRGYAGDPRFLLRNKTFHFSDILLSEMLGDVDLGVFWAGTHRGKYKQIFRKRFRATRGCFRPGMTIDMNTKIFAFKKQSREIRTQDGKELITRETHSSCHVEDPWEEFYDESFQLLVCGSGPCAIRSIKLYMEPPSPQDILESQDHCDDETEQNVVRFDGAASEDHEAAVAQADLGDAPTEFLSRRTVTVTSGGLTAVGVGEGRSVISQEDADKIADCAATRRASRELEQRLPRIVSRGLAAFR